MLLAKFLHALLAGDRLTRTFAGTCIGTSSLAAHRKAAAMTIAAIAADVAQPGDVLLNLPAKRAFHFVIAIDDADDLGEFFFAQFLGAALKVDAGFFQNDPAVGPADAENIRQADPDRLVGRNIDTRDTRHGLSLLLLVLHIRADHPHDAFAANDLAVFTDSSDACANFHDSHLIF